MNKVLLNQMCLAVLSGFSQVSLTSVYCSHKLEQGKKKVLNFSWFTWKILPMPRLLFSISQPGLLTINSELLEIFLRQLP